MAIGIEIWLGFTHDQFDLVRDQLKIRPDYEANELIEEQKGVLQQVDTRLKSAWHKAVRMMDFQVEKTASDRGLVAIQTPAGRRECYPFDLSLKFDQGEMGDEQEDAVIGVGLSGRYKPTFIDYRDPHGAHYCYDLDSPELDVAVKCIRDEISVFARAKKLALCLHY